MFCSPLKGILHALKDFLWMYQWFVAFTISTFALQRNIRLQPPVTLQPTVVRLRIVPRYQPQLITLHSPCNERFRHTRQNKNS